MTTFVADLDIDIQLALPIVVEPFNAVIDEASDFGLSLGIKIGHGLRKSVWMILAGIHAAFMKFYDANVKVEDYVGRELASFFFGF